MVILIKAVWRASKQKDTQLNSPRFKFITIYHLSYYIYYIFRYLFPLQGYLIYNDRKAWMYIVHCTLYFVSIVQPRKSGSAVLICNSLVKAGAVCVAENAEVIFDLNKLYKYIVKQYT